MNKNEMLYAWPVITLFFCASCLGKKKKKKKNLKENNETLKNLPRYKFLV